MKNLLTILSYLNLCLWHVCLTCTLTENWKWGDKNGNAIAKMLIPFASHSFTFPSTFRGTGGIAVGIAVPMHTSSHIVVVS